MYKKKIWTTIMLSDNDKVQLRQMIEKNNVVDKTDQIRELKAGAGLSKIDPGMVEQARGKSWGRSKGKSLKSKKR